jgi:hypothetical protein
VSRDVFISYKTEDRDSANRLCAALEREGISCWMAPRDIPPGQEWAAAIVDGLQKSNSFVLLLSSNSSAAKQIAREAELADRQNLPIMTFRLEEIQPPRELLYFLGNIQWLDGFGGQFDSAATRLAEVIRASANFPAPKTEIRHAPKIASTPTTTSIPSAPVPLPTKTRSPYFLPIIAGIVAVIGITTWLGLRTPAGDSGGMDKMQKAAKMAADRFLRERDTGDYDAAWNEYSTAFQTREDRTRWQTETDNRNRKHGGCGKHEFHGCQSGPREVYTCDYTLVFKDGSQAENELKVAKNDTGVWSIESGKVTMQQ